MSFVIPAKQPPLRSRRKKELYRLLVARSDIHASGEACKLLLEMAPPVGDPLFSALFSAVVVCYARPFTNNAVYGALPDKWRTFGDARLLQMHAALLKARHELVAHSDIKVRRAKIVPRGVVIGKMQDDRELRGESVGTQVSYYYFSLGMMKSVPALIRHHAGGIGAEIERLVVELYGGMELPHAAFDLRIDEGL